MKLTSLCAVALILAGACGRGADSSNAAPKTPSDSAVAAAHTADAIAANPAAADSILKAAGYTRDSFKAFMYEVAADSAMSASYAAAKSK